MNNVVAGATRPRIGDGNSPWNEAFAFSPSELVLMKRLHPELWDQSTPTRERVKAWRRFAQTSAGKAFRWR